MTIEHQIKVSFDATDYGTAIATVELYYPGDRGMASYAAEVTASGERAWAKLPGTERVREYKDHAAALGAALRQMAARLEHDWTEYAAEHAPGVR